MWRRMIVFNVELIPEFTGQIETPTDSLTVRTKFVETAIIF